MKKLGTLLILFSAISFATFGGCQGESGGGTDNGSNSGSSDGGDGSTDGGEEGNGSDG